VGAIVRERTCVFHHMKPELHLPDSLRLFSGQSLSSNDQEAESPQLFLGGPFINCCSSCLCTINDPKHSLTMLMDSVDQEVRLGMAGMIVPAPSCAGLYQRRSQQLGAGIHLEASSLKCLASGL